MTILDPRLDAPEAELLSAVSADELMAFTAQVSAEVRLSGYVLGALPFVCGLAIAVLNPKYLEPLSTDPLGRTIVLGGLLLWGLGGLWMRRLAQVDY